MNRPGESGDSSRRLSGLGEAGGLTVVRLLELDRWEVAVDLEQPMPVEPADPAEGGGSDVLDGAPGAAAADQIGLEQ